MFTSSKVNEKRSKEDGGYRSYSNTSRMDTSTEMPSFLLDGFYSSMHSSATNFTKDNHSFSTPSTFGTASLSSPTFEVKMTSSDGRGILIDRIKIAQNTIDSLSAKVFCYENEREQLREQKDAYEKGYYKLLEENSQILSDKIAKDALLKKINIMGDEVSQLLKAQEILLQKHNEQQKNIDFYKTQNKLLEDESESIRKVNDELNEKSARNAISVKKLFRTEEDLKNQVVVLKIEKEAQSSELERLSNKFQKQVDKIKHQHEKETSWIRELSLQQEQLRAQKDQLRKADDTIKLLQKEINNVTAERDQSQNDNAIQLSAACNEIATLKESLISCQKELQSQTGKNKEFLQSTEALSQNICQLQEELSNVEKEKEVVINDNFIKENNISDIQEQLKRAKRENKVLKQKLKNTEQEIVSNENSFKHKQEKLKHTLEQSERQVNDLSAEIERIQNDLKEEKQSLHKEHHLQILELESVNCKSQEIISILENDLKLLNQRYAEINGDYLSYKEDQENHIALKDREISVFKSNETKLCKTITEIETTNKQYVENSAHLTQHLHEAHAKNNVLEEDCKEKAVLLEKQQLAIQELSNSCHTLKSKNKENLNLIDMLNKQSKSEMLSEKALHESQIISLKTDVENLTTSLKNSHKEHRLSSETCKERIKSLQTEHDTHLENISNERDTVNTELHNAMLDLNEYKSKFTSLQKELEDVSLVNADLKENLSLLSKELESYQQDEVITSQKDDKIFFLEETIDELRSKISDLEAIKDICEKDKHAAAEEAAKTKEELTSLIARFQQHKKECENEKETLLAKEVNLMKEHKDSQIRVEKLKAECRKRAMQSHAKCGELEVFKAENVSMKKELEVVTELNNKLEQVNHNLQDERRNLHNSVQQSQEDIQLLKTSYEDLLAKELTKQRSEFLLKENQLLKRLSNNNLPMMAFQSSPIQSCQGN